MIQNKILVRLTAIFLATIMCIVVVPTVSADPTDYLVAYWKFDEGSGNTAYDSASDNDGTIYGATWTTDGKVGGALSFDGTGDYIYAANEENFDFDYDDAFTLEAWFKTSSNACINIISKWDSTPSHIGYQLIKHASTYGNVIYFFLTNTYAMPGGNQIRCWGTTDVADGVWHHVAVTYDGSGSLSGVNIYVDGNSETLSSTADTVSDTTTNDNPLQISGREGNNYAFIGCIDEVAIYNSELSEDEIDYHYCLGENFGHGYFNPPTLTYTGGLVYSDSSEVILEATLLDSEGFGMSGYNIEFFFDGESFGTDTTDINGVATKNIGNQDVEVYESYAKVYCLESDQILIAIYDPTDGFVTGGGWIYSEAGSYKEDPTMEGKANFGFVSKYIKGQSTPQGGTQFRLHCADFEFHSTDYDWLVIAGAKAIYKGTGTIVDREGSYKFMITAWDGDINGGYGYDTFRIKIWDEDDNGNENEIYDNGADTELSGGKIKIHS